MPYEATKTSVFCLFISFFIAVLRQRTYRFYRKSRTRTHARIGLIVGNWELTEVVISDAIASFDVVGIPVTASVTGSGSNYNLLLVFTEDNKVNATGSYLQNVSLQLGPQPYDQQQEIQASDFLNSGKWSRTTSELTINNGVLDQKIIILKLDDTALQLQLTIIQTQTIQDIPMTITGTITQIFARSD